MEYFEEFHTLLINKKYSEFLKLWEEYCTNDIINGKELCEILKSIKQSKFAVQFGPYVDTALPLHELIEDKEAADETFRLIIDLDNSNSPQMASLAFEFLKTHYANDSCFNEKIRLIGLRQGDDFQGAIRNYELLSHLNEGSFVYHNAGWGTGEIMELSLIREQLVVEFENVIGKKDVPFETAFKTLSPLSKEHFLARRFGDPDKLEEEAKKNPLKVLHLLLKDLGPKSAQEIKENICDLVIPEEGWSKWWQSARSKLKKDTLIEAPPNARQPFKLRKTEFSHEERFEKAINKNKKPEHLILTIYNFIRDFPEVFKSKDFKEHLKGKLLEHLSSEKLSNTNKIQIYLLLIEMFPSEKEHYSTEEVLKETENLCSLVNKIEVAGLKKKTLIAIQKNLETWPETFLQLLLRINQNSLREYLYKELYKPQYKEELKQELLKLKANPTLHPEAFVWYFQKLLKTSTEERLFSSKEDLCYFFEALMILFQKLEQKVEYRDLVKKIYAIITEKRYINIRNILEGSSITFAEELLLLVTKCQALKNHDISILQSLVEVVHPSLAQRRKQEDYQSNDMIWTTQKGYNELQNHIHQIATVETVANAKEIEVARSHGDLRENAEFKSALEKRTQLQAQLKIMTEQLNRARIITNEDISLDKTGIGNSITLKKENGVDITYILLGPWDADSDKNILSLQSKLAQAMSGHKVGDSFSFKEESYTIKQIQNYFEIQHTL